MCSHANRRPQCSGSWAEVRARSTLFSVDPSLNSLTLRYDDIETRVLSDRVSFTEFADAYLSAFKGLDWGRSRASRHLRAKLSFDSSYQLCAPDKGWRVGRDVWVDDEILFYRGLRTVVAFSLNEDDRVLVEVEVKRPGMPERVRRLLRPTSRSHDYQFLLRRVFHFPLFTLLGMRGFFVGHGAVIRLGEESIILVGVGGAGKSTLSVAMQLCYPEAVFITDNYVVVSDDQIFPFPEPLRIDREIFSRSSIASKFDLLMQIKDRDYFRPRHPVVGGHVAGGVTLLVIGRGSSLDVRPMSAGRGWDIFSATTLSLPREFPHGDYPAFAPYLQGGRCCLAPEHRDRMASRSFRVVVPSLRSEEQAVSVARQVIENVL